MMAIHKARRRCLDGTGRALVPPRGQGTVQRQETSVRVLPTHNEGLQSGKVCLGRKTKCRAVNLAPQNGQIRKILLPEAALHTPSKESEGWVVCRMERSTPEFQRINGVDLLSRVKDGIPVIRKAYRLQQKTQTHPWLTEKQTTCSHVCAPAGWTQRE